MIDGLFQGVSLGERWKNMGGESMKQLEDNVDGAMQK